MEIQRNDDGGFVIDASADELNLLLGGLRETFEALDDWEFSIRMGAERAEVEALADQLRAARDSA